MRFYSCKENHGFGARDDTGVVQIVNNLLPVSQTVDENREPSLSLCVRASRLNTLPALSPTCPRMPHVPGKQGP
ncbi:hypothetical protein EMIT047CA2_10558 [Pseudomonas soli]